MEDFSVAVAAVAAAAAAADPKPQSPYIALMMNQSAKSGEAEAPTLAVSGNDSAASALSEQTSSLQPDLTSHNCNPRKRKCPPKNKEGAENDRKEKCCNNGESTKEKDGNKAKTKDRNGSDTAESCPQQAADANATSAPPPKQDYIHVRARRGQATDSHSLAERVRREKISERMKILQDLVPGCNKITGKAVMLDEIINYVQALQRQVEFLSMKLAAVNPHPDSDLGGNYLAKDILQPHCTSAVFVPNQYQHPQKFASEQSMQCKVDEHAISEAAVRRMMDAQFHCSNGQSETMFQNLQMLHFWDNEFQNGMDPRTYNHSKSTPLTSHSFQGLLSTAHMKVEL